MGKGGSAYGVEYLPRKERATLFGIDTEESLVWRKWEPGGEYMRTVVIKNVSTKTQKVKYKLPETKYFTMDYPETRKLAAGTSFSLQVTFRPVKREKYDDHIEITCNTGVFYVPVHATLPYADLQAPQSLEFGFCPAKEVSSRTFSITNTGEKTIDFIWKLNPPFEFIPPSGRIQPGGSALITATFRPEDASVFVAHAVCEGQGEGEMAAIHVTGIAKYPYVKFHEPNLNFGQVLLGKAIDKTIRLSNQSLVPASVSMTRLETEHDHVFTFRPSEATIPPNSHIPVTVSYTPNCSGAYTCESFSLSTPGGNTCKLTCTGQGLGPEVRLSTSHVSFGSVEVASTTSRVVYIENASQVPVGWHFLVDEGGAFRFDSTMGTCQPMSSVHVTISFEPAEAANFHKRVVCLVKDLEAPLLMDISGTGYTDKKRPPGIKQHHIDAYYYRMAHGIPAIAPDGESLQDAPPYSGPAGSGASEPWVETLSQSEQWGELFAPDQAKPVSLDVRQLDFGACSRLRAGDYKQVTVHNRSVQKMTCFWVAPLETDGLGTGEKPRPIFTIFPEQADIKAGGSAVFRVAFRPGRDTFYYTHRLECHAYVKTMRNFRLVSEQQITPPWCLHLTAQGNTFVTGNLAGMPKSEFTTSRVHFPPTEIGKTAAVTVALMNYSDTPLRFDFPDWSHPQSSEGAGAFFSAWPSGGVVPAHKFSLVALRFCPTQAQNYAERLPCTLNHSPNNTLELYLHATGCIAKVKMQHPSVYFKPTCLGAISKRQVALQNCSKIPVAFKIQIPDRLLDQYRVMPESGTLQGGQHLPLEWTFIPHRQKQYVDKVSCLYRAVPSENTSEVQAAEDPLGLDLDWWANPAGCEKLSVAMLGEGTPGAVAMEPPILSFGTVQAHETKTLTVYLLNTSNGNLHFKLKMLLVSATGAALPDAAPPPQPEDLLQVSEPSGLLPARSRHPVKVTFKAPTRSQLVFSLECHTSHHPFAELPTSDSPRKSSLPPEIPSVDVFPSVEVLADVDFPLLAVSDVKCQGVGKRTLWDQMGISAINNYLAEVLTQEEETLRTHKGRTKTVEDVLGMLAPKTVSFSCTEYGAPPTLLHLELHNPGVIPVSWSTLLPTDQQVELENWVLLGEPTSEQAAHRAEVVDKKILDIWPRSGTLEPGQKSMVTLSYLHEYLGEHTLPLIINIAKGKKLHLVLTGKTIPSGVPVLQYLRTEHYFQPVALGETLPPVQFYELRNIGTAPVSYIVDVTSSQHLNNANWGFKVLECLNPQGTVPVGGCTLVKWRFQPIEAKTYQLDVPITIVGADSCTTVRFIGRGFHPKAEGTFRKLPQEDIAKCTNWPRYTLTPSDELEALTRSQFSLTYSALDLGAVPALSVARRVLTLASHAPQPFNFQWQLQVSSALEGKLVMEPSEGRIEPFEQLMIKVTYTAGGWPENFDVEVQLVLFPMPDSIEPPVATTDEEEYEIEGRHFRKENPRSSKVRESVAHAHTQASLGKFPNASLYPKPPTGFPTDFNMAATMTMTRQEQAFQGMGKETTLTLAVLGEVLTHDQFREKKGEDLAKGNYYIPTLLMTPPKRESLPPQFPPSDVRSIMEELLLEVTQHREVKAMFSPKQIGDDIPITFKQLRPDYKPSPRFLVDANEQVRPSWRESMLSYRDPTCVRFLNSFTPPPPPPPPPPPLEAEDSVLQKPSTPLEDKKKDKRTPAEIEADELAKKEAEEAERLRKEEEERKRQEEEAEKLRLEEEARLAAIAAAEQKIADAKEAERLSIAARHEIRMKREEELAKDEKMKLFLESPECMHLAEMILEGTLFNLLKENHKSHVLMD